MTQSYCPWLSFRFEVDRYAKGDTNLTINMLLCLYWQLIGHWTESLVVILFNKHLKNRNDRIQTFTPITLVLTYKLICKRRSSIPNIGRRGKVGLTHVVVRPNVQERSQAKCS